MITDETPFQDTTNAQEPPAETRETLPASRVLLILLAFFVVGNLLGSLAMVGAAVANGYSFTTIMAQLQDGSFNGSRSFVRLVLVINHLFTFILPALMTAFLVYKSKWYKGLQIENFPKWQSIGLGIVWFFVSAPFVQWAYQVNKMIPMPKWMLDSETQTGNLLKNILTIESGWEIAANIFLIGILPAISEELFFRGFLQKQLGRILKNGHLTVWLAAIVFSAIHMQFQGFFARMFLGALLGYAFLWSRTLWLPMILHFLNNAVQISAIYIFKIKPEDFDKISEGQEVNPIAGILSCVAAVAIGIVFKNYLEKKTSEDLQSA
jgi:uncharacterized protein